MSNDLQVRDNWDISQLSDSEMDLIQQKINQRKISQISKDLEEVKSGLSKINEKVDIQSEEFSNKFDDLQADNERKLKVAITTYRVDKNKWGFESQSDFGNRFRVSIGSQIVGRLFRIVGLAKSSKTGCTEPYREAINAGKASTDIVRGFEVHRWHHEKCVNHIEKWLKDHDLLEEFYSFDKEKDLQKFITDLFRQHVK